MTVLLDGNLLVGLVVSDHVHHDAAETWIERHKGRVATCPSTQGTLVRALVRGGSSGVQALDTLRALLAELRHDFWPDEVSYVDTSLMGVIGHRQVTDAYLAQLARIRCGRLATFDRGLASLHPDVADLVPV